MPKFLDDNGLLYFWQKIKAKFVTDVAYDSTNKKLTKTKNGATSDIVSVSTIKTALSLSKSDVGLGNVDNTSDASKPISTATQTALNGKVDVVSGKGLSTNDFTTTLKNKLNGIASGAEVNQNAFSNVKVGSTTVAADGKTDTLELVAGSNVTITPDATNDKVTIAATNTTYSDATTSASGLMSAQDKTRLNSIGVGISSTADNVSYNYVTADGIKANVAPVDSSTGLIPVENLPEVVAGGASGVMTGADKTKLNGIASGAEVNQNAFSNVKVGSTTVAADAKTDTLELVAGSNVTLTPDATNDKITIEATDTTYSNATTSAAGLMSASDKVKLNGITSGAAPNQNAFSTVKVGSKTIEADTIMDTLEIAAGSNILVSGDDEHDKVIISTSAEVNQTAYSKLYYGPAPGSGSSLLDPLEASSKRDSFGIFEGTNITVVSSTLSGIKGVKIHGPSSMTQNEATAGTETEQRTISPKILHDTVAALGGEPNQTAFSQIKIGAVTIGADQVQDAVTFVAGNNVSIVGTPSTDTITFSATDTTYSDATTSSHGLMTAADKTKLNKLVFDSNNLIDSSILPSYVDDVIEAYARSGQTALSSTWLATGSASGTVITPETGKIYVLMADSGDYAANTQFRWSGTAYVKLADGGVSAITNSEIDTILAA